MKKTIALLFAIITWFAVVAQFVLMIENRAAPISETIIRFFSFFTILTNMLVATYFTCLLFWKLEEPKFFTKPGFLTAITIYITIVGLVYQIALRHIWQPKGLQLIVDELLHSIIPILTLIFWCLYETIQTVRYSQIFKWTLYPLAYLALILVRGEISAFYPYPFINVAHLGMAKTITNATILLVILMVISVLFLSAGKKLLKR